jgi:hypothetical protein
MSKWSEWVSPGPARPYKLGCPGCGLVHDLEFDAYEVVEEKPGGWWVGSPMSVPFRVLFRMRRNERATRKVRARMQEGSGAQ